MQATKQPQEVTYGTISIQYLPFQEEQDRSKDLQMGKFLFPGFVRRYEVAYREVPGRGQKYFTGLEAEDYPADEQEEIQKAKDDLESYFGKNTLDPFNKEFWNGRALEITRKTTFLNMDNPEHRLNYYIIKGGGFREIASSYELAVNRAEQKRWYLVDATAFAEMNVEDDRKKNKAIAALEVLDEEKPFDDMFVVHKMLVSSDRGTTRKTPKGMIYKDLSDFIEGKIVRTNKKVTPKQFLEAVDLVSKDKKKAYITAYIKEGDYFHFLTISDDNQIKNIQTGTKYGSTAEKAAAYLANPLNQTELDNLKTRVEEKWNEIK